MNRAAPCRVLKLVQPKAKSKRLEEAFADLKRARDHLAVTEANLLEASEERTAAELVVKNSAFERDVAWAEFETARVAFDSALATSVP